MKKTQDPGSGMRSRLDDLDLSPDAGTPKDPPGGDWMEIPRAGAPERVEAVAAPLVDLPLAPAAPDRAEAAPAPSPDPRPSPPDGAAPLRARVAAFAADGALVLLLTSGPLMAATSGPERTLGVGGLWWAAVFALYLSFFATATPLLLFGKTVGMALTGLSARGGPGKSSLTAVESSKRWLGTVLTLAGLGIPLVMTAGDRAAPSPADRLSGRPLVSEA